MANLITTLGPIGLDQVETILPHEHVFVDLRTWDQPGYGEADTDDVVRLMSPEIERAKAVGVSLIVEPGPVGVGRRVDILLAVSQATEFPLVVPTGVYREPWMPPWVHDATEADLREWMIGELTGQVENTEVPAGFIKVAATDDGVTAAEAKLLRAAAHASAATGAAIGSHTVRGEVAQFQADVIESAGGRVDRFVWIHAHQEPNVALRHRLARRGVWLEYDGIGAPGSDQHFLDLTLRALDAGLEDRLLLSHDRGWYDPAQAGGGIPQPYTYLSETFLPKLSDAGVDDALIRRLIHNNPFHAFAR